MRVIINLKYSDSRPAITINLDVIIILVIVIIIMVMITTVTVIRNIFLLNFWIDTGGREDIREWRRTISGSMDLYGDFTILTIIIANYCHYCHYCHSIDVTFSLVIITIIIVAVDKVVRIYKFNDML